MAVVYIHMKPTNRDIFYIGIGNDIKRAYRNEGRNDHWTKVYNKYGKIVDIIATDLSLDAAKTMEKHLIASIGLDALCNKTLGGEGFFGGKHSKETIEKLRIASTGKKLSEETKRKIGEKSKGHPNYNYSHTEEAKLKISMAFKGKKRSEYFCQQVKKSKIGYCPSRKAIENAVLKRRENAILIKELTSGFIGKIWEIENKFNIDRRAVYYNCQLGKPIKKGIGKGLQFEKITTL
jgi:hypothetical protein